MISVEVDGKTIIGPTRATLTIRDDRGRVVLTVDGAPDGHAAVEVDANALSTPFVQRVAQRLADAGYGKTLGYQCPDGGERVPVVIPDVELAKTAIKAIDLVIIENIERTSGETSGQGC